MARVVLTSLSTTLCGLALLASAAQADPAEYAGASADGSKVFFTTTAKLVPGDTDNGFRDVYERFYDNAPGIETYVTREISTGPTGGNDAHDVSFDGVSSDGGKVFFSTQESLVAEDGDRGLDVYVRNTNTGETTLVSKGAATCWPACGTANSPATYVGSTPSGSKVFVTSSEQLAQGDGDEARDVYVRDLAAVPATTALVSRQDSTCSGCSETAPVTLPVNEGRPAISSDGTRVLFESTDKLAEGDANATENDIYERNLTTGRTTLVSLPGTCPPSLTPSECIPLYRGMSSDGTRVFLQTRAQLVGSDEDRFQDVYEWAAATEAATVLSTSSQEEEGNGDFHAVYAGASPDGSEVFFETAEKLAVADGDITFDVYQRSGGTTTLVSSGTQPANFNRVSADGGTVLFSTSASLPADEGETTDVYAWSGGVTTLVSAGDPAFSSTYEGSSSDAAKVFYATAAKLSSADGDEKSDIYEEAGSGPILISTGPLGGNGNHVPHLSAVSDNGARAFFTTDERLTVDDNFSSEQDVYERSAAGTLLVSVANSGELQLGPPPPGLTGTNPASPGASTEPGVLGEAEPGSLIKVYATPDCSGVPAGTGTAVAAGEPAAGTFSVAVTVAPGSATTFRATATNGSGDTSGCSTAGINYQQESVAPPPTEEGSGGGGGGGTDGGGSTGGSGGSTGGSGGTDGGSGGQIELGGVIYVTPRTRITFGPAAKTRSRRPVFRFADSTEQPGTDFVCKLDRRAWKGCGSPYRPPKLEPGRHVFRVKGRSAAGQWEQKPVTRGFKVVGR